MSHYYNWHPGAYKSAYAWAATYGLRADAPADAVDTLSQNIIAPILEKALAYGTILEYEVDELSVYTEAPGTFTIVYVTPTGEGVDKVNAAILDAIKGQPLLVPAWDSMTK